MLEVKALVEVEGSLGCLAPSNLHMAVGFWGFLLGESPPECIACMLLLPLLLLHGQFYTDMAIAPQASTAPCLQEARHSALLQTFPNP